MIRIGVDCRLAGHRHAGIGRYTASLVRRLPSLWPQAQWVYFFYDQTQADEVLAQLDTSQIEVRIVPIRHYSWQEQVFWPWQLYQAKLTLLHVPHFNVPLLYFGRLVITIHDVLWHEYRGTQVTTLPSWLYWFKYLGYQVVTGWAVARAAQILVPAQVIKQTLASYYPAALSKTIVTPEGVDYQFTPGRGSTNLKVKRTLVYIGSLYPHKNLKVVLEMMTMEPEVKLKIIGARSVFQTQTQQLVAKYQLGKRVQFLGYVPDEKIGRELTDALALIQPSLSEGFGLTGVEAMAAQVPVIASDIPIFREVYQKGAVFFEPHDPADLAKAVVQLQGPSRTKSIAAGLKVVKALSWDTLAAQTVAVYQRLIA